MQTPCQIQGEATQRLTCGVCRASAVLHVEGAHLQLPLLAAAARAGPHEHLVALAIGVPQAFIHHLAAPLGPMLDSDRLRVEVKGVALRR